MAKSSKGAALVRTPEVVEPENPAVALVQREGAVISDWIANARAFFHRATELELSAKSMLVMAEGFKVPTTGDQDAQLQEFIRRSNAGKKELTSHHASVTSALFNLHKWAVSLRKRGEDAYDRSTQIGNSLHSQFVAGERERARQEEDRLRREAEERERKVREAELQRLEREALRAENASPDLSERERRFVDHYVVHHNAPQAARIAGYKDADSTALRLLNTSKVKKAIESAETATRMREQANAVRSAPIEVDHIEVKPDIQKGGERTYWSADLIDERLFIQAVVSGQHGIPLDVLTVNRAKLNELARSLHNNLDRVPGVRAIKTTKVQ